MPYVSCSVVTAEQVDFTLSQILSLVAAHFTLPIKNVRWFVRIIGEPIFHIQSVATYVYSALIPVSLFVADIFTFPPFPSLSIFLPSISSPSISPSLFPFLSLPPTPSLPPSPSPSSSPNRQFPSSVSEVFSGSPHLSPTADVCGSGRESCGSVARGAAHHVAYLGLTWWRDGRLHGGTGHGALCCCGDTVVYV